MDEELQQIYEEAKRRGRLDSDPELHNILAEAVKRGRIRDLSHASVPTPPLPAQSAVPADPTVIRPGTLPPLSAPVNLPTGPLAAYRRAYSSNPELRNDPAQFSYDLASDSAQHGLASLVPETDAPGIGGMAQRGLKSILGLADAIPNLAYTAYGGNIDVQSGNPEQAQRGVDKLRESGQGAVPFSNAVTGYLEGLGTSWAGRDLPEGSPFRAALEEEGQNQRDTAVGSLADMIQQNPIEAFINAYPLGHVLAHPVLKGMSVLRDASAAGRAAASGIADPLESPVPKPVTPSGPPKPKKIVGADFAQTKELKAGESAPAAAKPKPAAVKRPKALVKPATTTSVEPTKAPELTSPTHSETPIPGTDKTLVMDAQVIPKPSTSEVPVARAIEQNIGKPNVVAESKTPSAPVPAKPAPATETFSSKKVSDEATLPGSGMTYKEYDHYHSLQKKKFSELTPQEREANDRYREKENNSVPLEQEDADILNAGRKKPKYFAGDKDVEARFLLDKDNVQRTKAAQSINADIKASKSGDLDTYTRVQNFLNDEANRYEDGEWRIDPKFVKPMEAYADRHFKALHEEYAPGSTESLETSSIVDRMVKEALEPNGSGRSSKPETRARYYRLRDEIASGNYQETAEGRKFLNNNKHLGDDYLDSRKDGVPEDGRGYEPGEPKITEGLRTARTIPAKSGVAESRPEYNISDKQTTTEPILRGKAASDALQNAKTVASSQYLDPQEIVHLSRLPEEQKAIIEATRQKAGLPSLYDYEDGVGIVKPPPPRALSRTEQGLLNNAVSLAKKYDSGALLKSDRARLLSLPLSERNAIEFYRKEEGLQPLFENDSSGAVKIREHVPTELELVQIELNEEQYKFGMLSGETSADVAAKGGDVKKLLKLREIVDRLKDQSAENLAENKRVMNKALKGVDPKQAGAWSPVALSDIAKDVALRLADKSLRGYESVNEYVSNKYGPAARKFHRTITDSARVYNASKDESVLPQGNLINRKGEEIDRAGKTFEREAATTTPLEQKPRPGEVAPLPLSRERIDKIAARQARGTVKRTNRTARTQVTRVASDLNASSDPFVRKLIKVFKQHKEVYENEVRPEIKKQLAIKAQKLAEIDKLQGITEAKRQELKRPLLYGKMAPHPSIKPLAQVLTPRGIEILRERIGAAGLRPFDRFRAVEYFDKMVAGEYTTTGERLLLKEVFGPELVGVMTDNRTTLRKNVERLHTYQQITTSLLFAGDRGSLLRNGMPVTGRLALTNPKQLGRAVGRMFSASTDIPGVTSKVGGGYRERFKTIKEEIKQVPSVASGEAQEMGIHFGGWDEGPDKYSWTDDGQPMRDADTEEMFAAKRIIDEVAEQAREQSTLFYGRGGKPVSVKFSPLMQKGMMYMARALQAAEYGHNTLLNTYRADMYERRSSNLKQLGFNTTDHPDMFKQVARDIMTQTGRGEFGNVFGKNLETPQNADARSLMYTVQLAPRFRKAAFDLTIGLGKNLAVEASRGFKGGYERGVQAEKAALALPETTPAELKAKGQALQDAISLKYSSLPRAERLDAMKSMASVAAIGGGVMLAAEAAGAKVDRDAFSPTFGKILWKNGAVTDVFQQNRQPIKLFLMMLYKAGDIGNATQRIVAKQVGIRQLPVSKHPSALDPALGYLVSGASPLASIPANLMRGKSLGGESDIRALNLVHIPLMAEDMRELGLAGLKHGAGETARNIGLGAVNYVGGNSYMAKPKKTAGTRSNPGLPSLSGMGGKLPSIR